MAARSRSTVRAAGSPAHPRAAEKPPLEQGRLAEAGGVRLRSYQVGALPILNRFLRRMKLQELLRQHLSCISSGSRQSLIRAKYRTTVGRRFDAKNEAQWRALEKCTS